MQNPGARTPRPLRVRSVTAWILGLLLVLIGLALGLAGLWLVRLGGSWYYVPAGTALLLTGVLLLLRRPAALWTYAALVLATLAWSLWETGLDWWPLAARGGVLFLLGLLLLLPRVTRSLDAGSPYYDLDRWDDLPPAPALYGGGRALALALAAFALVAVASWFHDAHEITGISRLPAWLRQVSRPLPTARHPVNDTLKSAPATAGDHVMAYALPQ